MSKERYYVYIGSFGIAVRDRTVEVELHCCCNADTPGVIKYWAHPWGVCKDADGNPRCSGHTYLKPEDEEAAEKLCAELNAQEE